MCIVNLTPGGVVGAPNGRWFLVAAAPAGGWAGDAIDWTTMEFDYTNAPSGITLAYGGAAGQCQGTLDCTVFPRPGTYYVATRVFSVSGIPSNWALCRITIDFGDYCP